MGQLYKDYKVYACFALNRLAAELGTDIYHEIRSNHYMTEKVISHLLGEGLAEMERAEGRYSVKITVKGLLHLRKFNELYIEMYDEFIRDHYRFSGAPLWLRIDRNR